MNSRETSIKHSALGWVKKSIDDNLSEISTDLKQYIEQEDEALLGRVKERLGVIRGVLTMIEQYGAAMLTEEMIALADFIGEHRQEKGEQALEVMLRAVLQLPDYLEHIQSGHRDIPIAILPLLNDIRAVRNQDLFSEKLLFLPDLSMHQEGAEVESIDEKQNQASKLLAKKLRPVYQLALLNVIKEQQVDESLKRLEKVCETLEERSVSEQIARIWWIVGALIESVSRQQLELGVSIKNLLGKVDALFRVILIIGERGLAMRQPIELIKNFLYYVAQPECDGPKAQAIKTAYRLEQFLPSESARSEMLDNIAGPNQALLKTVAEAMKADIEAVKSTLEVYVNGDLAKVDLLRDLPQEMHVISDTLAMIGLGPQRQLIEAQIEIVRQIADGEKPANEEQLLSMAAELLQVEQALDQMQKRQPVHAQEARSETDISRDYELDNVLTAVVTAALDDIQKIKNAILEFIKDSNREENINLCITLMAESRGALELIDQPRAVAVLDGLLSYLRGYDSGQFMESKRLEALSQAVVSLEYFLEALGEHRSDADGILDFADAQLNELVVAMQPAPPREEIRAAADLAEKSGIPTADTAPAGSEVTLAPDESDAGRGAEIAPDAVAEPGGVEARVQSAAVAAEDLAAPETRTAPAAEPRSDYPEERTGGEAVGEIRTALDVEREGKPSDAAGPSESAEQAAVPAKVKVAPIEEALPILKPGSDPDILEIYLEEAEEEAQNIARLQQDWLLHPEDENALKNIRRAFHTIKGSGRLVGAMKIGEFAWDFEQLLNRVIDKTVAPSTQVIDAVGKAARMLPELVAELKTPDSPQVDIAYLRGLAKALAEFRADQVLLEHTHQINRQESPYDHITGADDDGRGEIAAAAASQAEAPEPLDAELLNQIEPDTMRVDSTVLEPEEIIADATQGQRADSARGNFDDTLLAPPPQIPRPRAEASGNRPYQGTGGVVAPGMEYEDTQAIDGAPAAADEIAELPDDIESIGFDEIEPATQEAIRIETVGEDFVGDDFAELTVDDIDIGGDLAQIETTMSEVEAIEAESAEIAAALDNTETGLDDRASEAGTGETVMQFEPAEFEGGDLQESADETGAESAIREDVYGAPAAGDETRFEASTEAQISPPESRTENAAPDSESAVQAREEVPPPDPFVDTTGSRQPGEAAEPGESTAPEPLEPTGLSFDPELLIIYQQEVEQHLSIVNSALDRAEEARELVPTEEVYRALHTIHGASRTADIISIGQLAALLEKPLKAAISQNLALDHEIVELYRQGLGALQAMLEELVATRQLPAIPADIEVSLKALAEDLEEYTVELPDEEQQTTGEFIDTLTMMVDSAEAEPDNELLTIFVDEANELLEMSDNTLHEWTRQESDDTAREYGLVMELQRYLHTLKGGARMAEINEISNLAHEMESLFIAVIDGRVEKNDQLIESLKDCFDLLHQQVGEAQQGQPITDSASLLEDLRKLRFGDDAQPADEIADESFEGDSENIDIVAENLQGDAAAASDRSGQDVIKVRSDLLDNLVNSAGEVSIYRARMEQQVAGLGSYLGELGQTIARLKGQLRNLEAETDAQIHYSHRAEATRAGDFDPLELDRYTMIQELSRSLSESVNDLSSLQTMLGEQVRDSETLLLQQSRVSADLQDGLIKSRMVKFSGLLSRLRRLVRQSGQELGKKAELVVTGEDNEVDNKVLDRMVAPLEHIIRNALSHGIETPVERVKKGKPETGRITIDISRDGSDVVIRVSDDGSGVNIEKVRSRAIQLGLLDESQPVGDADLVQYILEPGFSTAEHVTQLSGRGVGMDVVDIEIKQLGGTLQIETTPKGTTFVARLPFTLSINQAILVRTADETYAIPLINIEGITRLDLQTLVDYYRQETPEIEYAGQRFALHSLAKLVDGNTHFRSGTDEHKQPVILGRVGDVRVALYVDEIIGNREIVVKSLGKQLSQVKGLAGASILADGSVVLILDIAGLVRQSATSQVKVVYQPESGAAGVRSTVMVVDDSITMRRVASKLLERHNYEVVTAKDGVDALAQLQDVRPDVMLLDIEMPRMDGFELATHMQNEESYARIPIIMITSRTGEKHRDRALEIGVTDYMGKPYQEDELIETIQSALGARRA